MHMNLKPNVVIVDYSFIHSFESAIIVHIKPQNLYISAFPAFPVIILVLTFGKTISIDAIFNRFFDGI